MGENKNRDGRERPDVYLRGEEGGDKESVDEGKGEEGGEEDSGNEGEGEGAKLQLTVESREDREELEAERIRLERDREELKRQECTLKERRIDREGERSSTQGGGTNAKSDGSLEVTEERVE
ncbi:uncharacterized protein LOC131230470 [Magnolia sinica]|uniref:uncharacterized protein LOC131230470 n=1 Tax=Magnolia sinica TaxID=86752 RepID=UPI00265B0739|nr:uncharacterized protein LOC131230470 [Magnolia sinica]